MDCRKTGSLIRALRLEKGLTQKKLAEKIGVSTQAVSKWERGLGCPDISLLPDLSRELGVMAEDLLRGELNARDPVGGNMKKVKFYVCPVCQNLITQTGEGEVSCCGKRLAPMEAKKAEEHEKLKVELIETEYFISSDHEMTKEHYIPFLAFLNGDTLIVRKMFPEWNLETRLPRLPRGMLYWYCSQHGLFSQRL